MRRVFKNEEERKEAKKKSDLEWRQRNREKLRSYTSNWLNKSTTHYVVYTHTNSEGAMYIGCGHNLRPYQFSKHNRSELWHEVFDNNCEIKIVAEFKDKESARELEGLMIEEIGLDNLINIRK